MLRYIYTQTNHNSLLGIREYAVQKGASFEVIEMDKIDSEIEPNSSNNNNNDNDSTLYVLYFENIEKIIIIWLSLIIFIKKANNFEYLILYKQFIYKIATYF